MANGFVPLELHSSTDGYPFYIHRYLPAGKPIARLVWMHGIRSHAGWYARSARKFAASGYEVHLLDRRGSGWNTAHRGDTPSFRRLILDVAEYLYALRAEKSWLPVVLAGVSWGGKQALGVAAEYPRLVDGVVLLCPGLSPQRRPPFASRLRIALARFLRPTRPFPIPLNEPELFTSDPHWQRFIATNPHDLHEATARFLFESVRFDFFLRRNVERITQPVLLMLAEHDRVIDNARTRAYLTRLTAARNVSVIDYPGAHHTLEFEPESHPWFDDMRNWISKRVLM